MARIRSIHPEACTSERLASVSAEAERCYWRLQTHCDDEGRAEDHPRLIWAALFPLLEKVGAADVDKWLQELDLAGLIERYVVDGHRYLAVTQWERFQHPQRPRPSRFPEPSVTRRVHVAEEAVRLPLHVPAGEGGEMERERETCAPTRAPTRGTRIPDPFDVTDEMAEWAAKEVPQLDWRKAMPMFMDFWRAAPGQKGVKTDWPATWRNWMRRQAQGAFR